SLTIADGSGEPERYIGGTVTWDLFPLLGVAPIKGHGFQASDDLPGAPGVVLLGYDVWMNRYQGQESILGRTILVNAQPAVVVGIMPKGFAFPNNQKLWIPLGPLAASEARGNKGLFVLGRLKPGVSAERATQELDGIADRLAKTYPETNQ